LIAEAAPTTSAAAAAQSCVACGAPLADDQRYCLECGDRRAPISSVLLGGPPSGGVSQAQSSPPMAPPSAGSTAADGAGRGNAVTLLAGVGVLLLAMGVGVLIGRSSAPKQSAAPAQTISVTAPAAAAAAGAAAATPEAASKAGSSSSKAGSKKGASSTGASKSGVGSSESHPAPPSVLKNLSKKKGKNYEQESKNLPDVISTG
jgi:hypothetical protein